MFEQRKELLVQFARNLANQAQRGKLKVSSSPTRIEFIAGPRVGAIEVYSGMEAGTLYKALNQSDNALARQLVPWKFTDLYIYMSGKAVRIEVPWPPDLVESDMPLTRYPLPSGPKFSGKWFAGKNDTGKLVTLGFTDNTPNFLFSGSTGSGKSVAIASALWQLTQLPENHIVLIDGKQGDGLRACARLPNQVGPMVTNRDPEEVLIALSWVKEQMNHRYIQIQSIKDQWEIEYAKEISGEELVQQTGRIILVIDEVQEIIEEIPEAVSLLRAILAQGRAANVNTILSTQQPTADVFKDRTIKPNLPGRVALRTTHAEASRAALGQSFPRADWLQGKGDAYCLTSHSSVHRVQISYVPTTLFPKTPAEYEIPEWGQVMGDIELGGGEHDGFTEQQVAAAIYAAGENWGRTKLLKFMDEKGITTPSRNRATKLVRLGRQIQHELTQL